MSTSPEPQLTGSQLTGSQLTGPQLTGPQLTGPPEVDHPAVAEALQQLGDLDEVPLNEHHDRLSRAHEVLHGVLHPDPGPS